MQAIGAATQQSVLSASSGSFEPVATVMERRYSNA
jgi:hypothetical protein